MNRGSTGSSPSFSCNLPMWTSIAVIQTIVEMVRWAVPRFGAGFGYRSMSAAAPAGRTLGAFAVEDTTR